MTLRHLRIFAEVCKLESMTRAAESLNMAQPAVSGAVRELEAFYGVRLFERMNRRIYTTNAGQYLRTYADSILTQFDEAKDVIQDIAAATRIRIGSNVSFGDYYLPQLISGFSNIHPEIPLYTMIQNSAHIEQCLLQNKLDFAIVDYDTPSGDFHHRHLLSDYMTVVCSPDFPYLGELRHRHNASALPSVGHATPYSMQIAPLLSLQDFSRMPLLLREPGSGSRNVIEQILHEAKIEPVVSVESISTQALIAFCLNAQGILILPDALVRSHIQSRRLIELKVDDITFARNYYLLYHKSKYLTASMTRFMEYLKSSLDCR